MSEACKSEKDSQKGTGADKGEEVPVIAPANAVVEPNTVVILSVYAVVADTAVVATRRSPDVAGFAILYRYFHGCVRRARRLDPGPRSRRRRQGEWVVRGWSRHGVKVARKNLDTIMSKVSLIDEECKSLLQDR